MGSASQNGRYGAIAEDDDDGDTDGLQDEYRPEARGPYRSCVSFKTVAIFVFIIMACVITGLTGSKFSRINLDKALEKSKQQLEQYATHLQSRLNDTLQTDIHILNKTWRQSVKQVNADIQSLKKQMELDNSDLETKLNKTLENERNMHDELLILNKTFEEYQQEVHVDIASLKKKIALAQAEIDQIEDRLNGTTRPATIVTLIPISVVTTTPTSIVTQTTTLPQPNGAHDHSRGSFYPTRIMYLLLCILIHLINNKYVSSVNDT